MQHKQQQQKKNKKLRWCYQSPPWWGKADLQHYNTQDFEMRCSIITLECDMCLSTHFWPCPNHWKHEITPLNKSAGWMELFGGECQDRAACPSLWLTADQPCPADWLSGCWRRHYLSRSWGGSLTATPAAFSCSQTAVFADWTAGVVTPTPGGQLIPSAAPQSVSDGGPALQASPSSR